MFCRFCHSAEKHDRIGNPHHGDQNIDPLSSAYSLPPVIPSGKCDGGQKMTSCQPQNVNSASFGANSGCDRCVEPRNTTIANNATAERKNHSVGVQRTQAAVAQVLATLSCGHTSCEAMMTPTSMPTMPQTTVIRGKFVYNAVVVYLPSAPNARVFPSFDSILMTHYYRARNNSPRLEAD